MADRCTTIELISSLKIPLYMVSAAPLIYSWFYSGLSRLPVFLLSIIFVLASQFLMNTVMDRLDRGYGKKCIKRGSFIPVGPCIFECIDARRMMETVPLIIMLAMAVLVLIITRLLLLIAFGVMAIILMFAYLYPPLMLYRRGIGEISTFFDFGPLLLLGTYYAFTGNIEYLLLPASIGFGLVASAIRLSHHIIEEPESSTRKKLYAPAFFIMVIASSLVTWKISATHVILTIVSLFVAIMPNMVKDSQKVTSAALVYLIIFAFLA
ncbi:MAG: hypothetical protein ACP5TZ_06255 [Nitrososphaeria archaeon]